MKKYLLALLALLSINPLAQAQDNLYIENVEARPSKKYQVYIWNQSEDYTIQVNMPFANAHNPAGPYNEWNLVLSGVMTPETNQLVASNFDPAPYAEYSIFVDSYVVYDKNKEEVYAFEGSWRSLAEACNITMSDIELNQGIFPVLTINYYQDKDSATEAVTHHFECAFSTLTEKSTIVSY